MTVTMTMHDHSAQLNTMMTSIVANAKEIMSHDEGTIMSWSDAVTFAIEIERLTHNRRLSDREEEKYTKQGHS